MADEETSTPYSTTTVFVESNLPSWLNEYDAARLAAYKFYDDLYRNDPSDYKLILRGSEEMPIYIPTAKRIVNVLKRYVGRNLGFTVGNLEGDEAVKAAITIIGDLFDRERVVAQFNAAKQQSICLGDGCIHISADPMKPLGSRIKIIAIDPATYFPIVDETDPDKIVGCDIVERILDENDDSVTIKRQRYLKWTSPEHPNFNTPDAPITYEAITMKEDDWEDELKRVVIQTLTPQTLLPGITQLPVYHFKFQEEVGNPYGTSALQGFERIILGLNQTATDEDVAVAMAGLGMYHSDSTPVDEDGNETSWVLGPSRVVETPPGGVFNRISGITSLEPSQGHINFLLEQIDTTLGISDVALGKVDTTVAESGIALALRLGPLLDVAEEQNVNLLSVLNQMFHDLKMWLTTYESQNLGDAVIRATFDSPIPQNKEKESDRLQDLYVNQIISKAFYRQELSRLFGYQFPENMDQQIVEEQIMANPYFEEEPAAEETPEEE